MSELWVIYGLVFVAAILVVEGLYWLMFDLRGRTKTINRRLSLGAKISEKEKVLEMLRAERGLVDFQSPRLAKLNDFFVQTGARISAPLLILWTTLIAAAMVLLLWKLLTFWPALGIGLIGAPALVAFYLSQRRRKRIERFAMQLPEAIDIIVRGLRVGHPFSTALEHVARELPDPIGTEFGICADEMIFGKDVNTAVSNLYRRVGQDDLMFLTIAVSIQAQTGGNLADVLSRLAKLMRERVMMLLKVRALSAEGRMSAWFLTAMPFVLYAAVQTLSKDYYSDFIRSAFFIPGLIYIVLSLVISNFVIYRMVNFKV